MTLEAQVSQQRVKHIISSYQLEGDEAETFVKYLHEMLHTYAAPLIELALTETIVSNWLTVPMVKGVAFLDQAHTLLQRWESSEVTNTLTPEQFQQVTGLDPSPVFGSSEMPSIVHPR